MKAKYIIEAANHPTDPEADEARLFIALLFIVWNMYDMLNYIIQWK